MSAIFGVLKQIESEQETELQTREYLKLINEEIPIMIDLLFKTTNYVEPIDISKVNFKSYCHDHYVQVPYTFKCLYNIYVFGYYNEAIILLRHLYEILARLRYFYKHENRLESYLKGRNRIKEREFFTFDVGDAFYKTDYDILSKFTHGKELFKIFRTDKESHKIFKEGNFFEKEYADLILMQITALLYGYINCYVLFFPNNELDKNIQLKSLYNDTIIGLQELLNWHKNNNPLSVGFYNSIEKLICI